MTKRQRSYSIMCTCDVCRRRFRASRKDAKYCSDVCRKKKSRSRAGQDHNLNTPDASRMTFYHLDLLSRTFGGG